MSTFVGRSRPRPRRARPAGGRVGRHGLHPENDSTAPVPARGDDRVEVGDPLGLTEVGVRRGRDIRHRQQPGSEDLRSRREAGEKTGRSTRPVGVSAVAVSSPGVVLTVRRPTRTPRRSRSRRLQPRGDGRGRDVTGVRRSRSAAPRPPPVAHRAPALPRPRRRPPARGRAGATEERVLPAHSIADDARARVPLRVAVAAATAGSAVLGAGGGPGRRNRPPCSRGHRGEGGEHRAPAWDVEGASNLSQGLAR